PQLQSALALALLVVVALLANFIVKRVLVRGLYRLFRNVPQTQQALNPENSVIARLANVVPALIISLGIKLVPGLPEGLVTVIQNVAGAFIVLTIALAVGNVLNLVNELYERRPDANQRPIKGYLLVLKIG